MAQERYKKLVEEWDAETAEEREKNFGKWAIRLLFEINSNLDSLSACYREMTRIQVAKHGKENQTGAQQKRKDVSGFGARD